jgi:hypothetical protein
MFYTYLKMKFGLLAHFTGPGQINRYSDSLRAGRSGDRIPVGSRFSAPVHTGPGPHPASFTMGTGSFPGVKRPGRDIDHPPLPSAVVKEGVQLYLSPGSSVDKATGYVLDGLEIKSRWVRDFPHVSRPALGPTQPAVQWVPCLSRG